MRIQSSIKLIFVLSLSLFLELQTIAQSQKGSEKPVSFEFHTVNADIFSELYQKDRTFLDLLNQKSSIYPETLYDKYFLFQLYLRAGMLTKANEVLDDLIFNYPSLDNHTFSSLYREVSKFDYPTILRTILNAYGKSVFVIDKNSYYYNSGERIKCYGLGLFLLQNLYEQEKWSFKKIQKWIKTIPDLTVNERANYLILFCRRIKKTKKLKSITKRYEHIIRENNTDIAMFIENLETISYTIGNSKVDLTWVSKEIFPTHSTDALIIAKYLSRLHFQDQAEHFYRIALSIELTGKDYKYLENLRSRRVPYEILNVSYKLSLLRTLSEILLDKGNKEEAHAMMLKSLELSKQNHIPPNMFYAGQLQRGTGIYYVEQEILKKEDKLTDSIGYWKERYEYYLGRKKIKEAEEAIQNGLNILTNQFHKDTIYQVKDYEYFINQKLWMYIRQQKYNLALNGYIDILNHSVTSSWAKHVIYEISDNLNSKQLDIWEKVFWKYLEYNTFWNNDFIRMLLAGANDTKEQELILHKLDSLANGCPFRAYNLALSLYDEYPEKSIKYFEYARTNYPGKGYDGREERVNAAEKLVNFYINSGNMKNAEIVLQEMKSKYVGNFVLSNLRKMTIHAAKNKDFTESLRLWSILQNINPSDITSLTELCQNGMSEYLGVYYKEVAKKFPESNIPKKAISEIKKHYKHSKK